MNPFWSMSTGSVRKVFNEWMPESVVMLGRGGSSAGKKTSGDLQIVFYCVFIPRAVITFSKSVNWL